MTHQEYRQKQLVRQDELLRSFPEEPGIDRDIWNLEYILTEIRPGSLAWRRGYIRSLHLAIRALEREKKEERNG